MHLSAIQDVINKIGVDQPPLLQVLLAVQDADPQNHISEEAVSDIAKALKISRCRVYSTASFYSEIALKPRGQHLIRVCSNAPCENAGKAEILEAIIAELGVGLGETTPDKKITLEKVNCLGACYKSPAIKIDHTIYGDLTPQAAVELIRILRKEEQHEQTA